MGLKDHLADITGSLAGGEEPAQRPTGRSPRTAPGQLFAFSAQAQELQEELDRLKKEAGAPRMLLLSSIRPSPYQTKAISEQKVAELAANFQNNEMTSPIVVREVGPGVFETIAGHHRILAHERLGRAEIKAIVVQMSDETAEGAVFYDNFFPPEMTDYEKFRGLAQLRRRNNYTHEALAERSGISRQLIGYLLAFEKLPEDAHLILKANPGLIGATLAGKLAALPHKAQARIAEGLDLVATRKLTAGKLLDWLVGKKGPPRSEQTVIKAGRSAYAKVQRREARLTIDFTHASDAEALEREIAEFLKTRAAEKK